MECYIALKDIASQQKVTFVLSYVRTIFRVAHSPSVPRSPLCLSTLWLSCSPRVQENRPSSCLKRDSGLGDVVQRAVCSRSLELHARRWPPYEPPCFSPCQACCSRLLFSLSHTAKRILCTVDDSRGLSQSRTRFLTTSRFTVFDIWFAVCFSKLFWLHYFHCICWSWVRTNESRLNIFLFNQPRRKWNSHACIISVWLAFCCKNNLSNSHF